MITCRIFLPIAVVCFLFSCRRTFESVPSAYVDSSIQSELRQITAIDNHAHPVKVVALGEEDHDYDALPGDAISDMALPTPFRQDSPYFQDAWHVLFNYKYRDDAPVHIPELLRAKREMMKQKGDQYPLWVLNNANTDVMLANRVAMGRGLPSDRFKWVPFVDTFVFPLNNMALRDKDPEHNSFIQNEELLLRSYLAGAKMKKVPATLDEYLTFISHHLESWKGSGAVALKFELAYLRDLDISNPSQESAERVYTAYAQRSEPTSAEYKILQDYIFRHIAHEAGRLNLAVHMHTSIGVGSYFRSSNANPLALEGLFNDPSLRKTKFVMIHGAWPFAREAAALILKPNVYLDYSAFMYLTYPTEAARALRLYLEAAPEKVLYGSDASPFSNRVSWEETAWIASRTGRLSLGIALTGMVRDGEITMDRAKQIGRMVLRGNAHQLYGF